MVFGSTAFGGSLNILSQEVFIDIDEMEFCSDRVFHLVKNRTVILCCFWWKESDVKKLGLFQVCKLEADYMGVKWESNANWYI